MKGGTGRLQGWDDGRGYVFRPVSPRRDPGFSNRDPDLSETIFVI